MILYFFSYTLEICNLKIELQINVFFCLVMPTLQISQNIKKKANIISQTNPQMSGNHVELRRSLFTLRMLNEFFNSIKQSRKEQM